MARPMLEVADIFRDHGASWRDANRGHVSLDQMKVMNAIERCRTAALGVAAHVDRPKDDEPGDVDEPRVLAHPCPSCGGRMIIVEVFAAGCEPRQRATLEGSTAHEHARTSPEPQYRLRSKGG